MTRHTPAEIVGLVVLACACVVLCCVWIRDEIRRARAQPPSPIEDDDGWRENVRVIMRGHRPFDWAVDDPD